jgi:hypothetical protein
MNENYEILKKSILSKTENELLGEESKQFVFRLHDHIKNNLLSKQEFNYLMLIYLKQLGIKIEDEIP